MFRPPPLYAITDAGAGMSHAEQVARFLRGGARLIQIRDKRATALELFEAVVAALGLTRPAGALLVVNDRADVAVAAGADGVHVGQDDLPASAAREMLGPGRVVGVSTHTAGQAREAAGLPVDYVAVGPVFATPTKENPDPVVGLELVREARAITSLPVVAIGGITLARARGVLDAGASSVAVIGDLRAGASIESRVAEYLAELGASR